MYILFILEKTKQKGSNEPFGSSRVKKRLINIKHFKDVSICLFALIENYEIISFFTYMAIRLSCFRFFVVLLTRFRSSLQKLNLALVMCKTTTNHLNYIPGLSGHL